MAYNLKSAALVAQSSVAYVLEIKKNGTGTDYTPVALWDFSDVAETSIKPKIASGSSSSTATIDKNTADGRIIKYTKDEVNISGQDESLITSASGVTNASGLGEMTISTEFMPTGATYTSPTVFLAEILAKKASTFLIVLPTGYTGEKNALGTTKKSDGWGYMIGALSADPEYKAGSPIALTFAATTFPGTLTIGASFFATKGGVAVKRGGTDVIAASNNVPTELIAADITSLVAGNIVIKPTP